MSALASVAAAFFGAVASGFGWALERLRINNSPEMRANADARTQQKLRDKANRAVAQGDIDKVRRLTSQ
jgi:hypothetical protein